MIPKKIQDQLYTLYSFSILGCLHHKGELTDYPSGARSPKFAVVHPLCHIASDELAAHVMIKIAGDILCSRKYYGG